MDAKVAGTGAEDTGLICGWVFEPGEGARELRLNEAAEALAGRRGGGFAWLHFNLSHMGAQRWLQRHGGLAPAFLDALGDQLPSTRIERDDKARVVGLPAREGVQRRLSVPVPVLRRRPRSS
jgi:zinc transporter